MHDLINININAYELELKTKEDQTPPCNSSEMFLLSGKIGLLQMQHPL
jgi:hypothetical protein